jgi:hypothetical protein
MSEEIIEKKTIIKDEPPPKPVVIKQQRTTSEAIQVARFWARFFIAGFALAIFAGVVYIMLMAGDELPTSSKDLLNILIGSFIPILTGIAKFYFESGGDLDAAHPPTPPKDNDVSSLSADAAK